MVDEGACGSYEVLREGDEVILRIECEKCTFFPSIEDSPRTMAMAINLLAEVGGVTKIVFVQKRDYEYDYAQILLLTEISKVYKHLSRHKGMGILSDPTCARFTNTAYAEFQDTLHRLLKSDPLGAYVELARMVRREDIRQGRLPPQGKACVSKMLRDMKEILGLLENTNLVKHSKHALAGFKTGDRDVYRQLFAPNIKPDFMFAKLQAS